MLCFELWGKTKGKRCLAPLRVPTTTARGVLLGTVLPFERNALEPAWRVRGTARIYAKDGKGNQKSLQALATSFLVASLSGTWKLRGGR